MPIIITPETITPKVARRTQSRRQEITPQYNPYGISEDFKMFARSCQVRSGTEFVPFELFDWQEEVDRLFDKHRGLAIWKTRQTGASELLAAKMLHRSLLNPAYLGVAFSLGQQESSKLSDRVGMMPSQISDFRWATDSKTARKSERGGELLFRPSTPNAARSLASVTDLFFDECGFPPDIGEMYGNATPAQSMVGDRAKRILATTIPPEGLACWFGQTFWNESDLDFDLEEEIARVQEGKGRHDRGFSYWIDDADWVRILLHWHSHPIYSAIPNYLEKIKASEKLTDDQLQREHNLGLPKDGASLFSAQSIAQCSKGTWSDRIPGHFYLMGIDPNFGAVAGDYFVAQVWDLHSHPIALVAEYRSNTASVTQSKAECLKLIDHYRSVIVSIETNAGGMAIAEDLILKRSWVRVEQVRTTTVSKRMNTDRIAVMVQDGDVSFPADWHGIREMKHFSAIHRAATNGNDDCVMAMAIAMAWLDEALTLRVDGKAIEGGQLNEGMEPEWENFFEGY